MVRPVKRIVIVGGGTAGWLTAGVIAAKHRNRMPGGFSVTVVESPNVPIIGVGEGTWPTLRSTLSRIGVSETEFIRQLAGEK
jgi:tryptophan halogenase